MDTLSNLPTDTFAKAADAAARAIPPAWPLASSVAVNPFLGQTGESLAMVGARLDRIGGVPVTMPRDWYQTRIADGTILDEDIAASLEVQMGTTFNVDDIKRCAAKPEQPLKPQPTIADLASEASGIDWVGILSDRIGLWAAGYFDQGQALWAAPLRRNAYDAWRQTAIHDLTPEIAGLTGFAQFVSETPDTAQTASLRAINTLCLNDEALETYLHQLLFSLGGWAQLARYKMWQAELAEEDDTTVTDLLTVRLLWEEALLIQYQDQISSQWDEVKAMHATPLKPARDFQINAILQEAWERSEQRALAQVFAAPPSEQATQRPALQAAFCIDVRSEVFRRALENIDPSIHTLGFAGFFGLATSHKSFASDVEEHRLPVLLNPGVSSTAQSIDAQADLSARFSARANRAWGRFKQAAVSSFAFVEATGPIYAGKLVRDTLNVAQKSTADDPAPTLDPALDLTAQIDAAETILRAMSFTQIFARLVVLVGHGAHVVNNPFASGLHCGACGGYSGEVNARLLAGLLNSADLRTGLRDRDVDIPSDAVFVGALHDTTTDAIKIYAQEINIAAHSNDIAQAKRWFAAAGAVTRSERALRLPRAAKADDVTLRRHDWAETRPEWALAGCKAFIAAPRHRTMGKNLEGRAFLHDYDWQQDTEFGVLELIMTAPVVVASWISLQYYGSTVAPDTFGAGNKLLHNVSGGIGVFEGNGGTLRAGLPWQSIHDGDAYTHDPLRLSVCIEAPREAMSAVLKKHDAVRALFDNRWLHLFALDENGQMAGRYNGDLKWSDVINHVEAIDLKVAS